MPSTFEDSYVDRDNTNGRVYLNAACVLAQEQVSTPLSPLSSQIEGKQRLLAFLASPRGSQPEIKATFWFPPSYEFRQVSPLDSLRPNISSLVRRVGRPRGRWVRETISEIWSKIRETDPSLPAFDFESEAQRDRLIHDLQTTHHLGI